MREVKRSPQSVIVNRVSDVSCARLPKKGRETVQKAVLAGTVLPGHQLASINRLATARTGVPQGLETVLWQVRPLGQSPNPFLSEARLQMRHASYPAPCRVDRVETVGTKKESPQLRIKGHAPHPSISVSTIMPQPC